MKVKTRRLFVVLTVVAALLLTGPAWAAPKKGETARGGGAPATTSAALKEHNRVQDKVRLENLEQLGEQDQEEGDQVEEDVQQEDQVEGEQIEEEVQQEEQNQNQVENEIKTQAQERAKVQDQGRLKAQAQKEVKIKEELQHQEQEEGQVQNQKQEQEQAKVKVKAASGAAALKVAPQRGRVGPQIFVNGQLLKDALPPVVKEGTTLVPLRALAARLKAQVSYDAATKTVTVVKQEVTIQLSLTGGTVTLKDQLGQEKTVSLPVPPQVINGYTFVPLRFIAETFAASVSYDPTTGIITVQEPEAANPAEAPAAPAATPTEESAVPAATPAAEPTAPTAASQP